MARAKRTDRAEARRRYRATTADPLEEEVIEEGISRVAPRRSAPTSSAPGATGTVQRPSILGAFRSSFRPVDWRADIRALPRLLRHWSFYVPVVLSGVAVVLGQYLPHDPLVGAFVGYFSGITPFGSVFLAGFFAPRASYLVGALVSLAAAGFLALSYTVQFSGLPNGQFVALGVPGAPLVSTEDLKTQYPIAITQALTSGTLFGAIFASAAAWYRRFLNRANPNRTARPSQASSRRPDGKVPKRNEQRPILARRR